MNNKNRVPLVHISKRAALPWYKAWACLLYTSLKEGIDASTETATILDIAENPQNLEIVEMEAKNIPHSLPDVAFAVINGNYEMCIRDRSRTLGLVARARAMATRCFWPPESLSLIHI